MFPVIHAARTAVPASPVVERTRCRICGGPAHPIYQIQGTRFFSCHDCDFLFNTYWDEHAITEQREANDTARIRHSWGPSSDPRDMRRKGWECLSYMASPIAWRSRRTHDLLLRLAPYRALHQALVRRRFQRILDFGCGYGEIVRELRADGFDCLGLDPFSPTDHPAILRTRVDGAPLAAESFDGIFSIETIEHIPNVLETFRALARLLKARGVLLVQTRRLEDPGYRDGGADWFYLADPVTHVSIYSETALRQIAARTGFRGVRVRGVRLAKFIK